MLLADTCAEGSLTAAKGDINSRSILGDRTTKSNLTSRSILGDRTTKSRHKVRPHRVARHTAHGIRTGLTTPNTLPVRSAARFAPSCSRDVAHESRSGEAEALAWARVHGGGGAARPRGAPRAEGTREAEEAARASRTERRGAWHHLQWTIGSERAARR